MRSSLFASSCATAALLALSIAPISLATPTAEAEAPTPSTQVSSPAQPETPTPEASPSTSASSSVDSTTSSGDTPTGDNIPSSEDRSATDDFASLSPEEQIRQRWQDMGAENGVLGAATSGLVPLRDGAFIQFYRGGQIYWTAQYGAHASRAGIHSAYGAQKWENGPLGFPTSDEEVQTIGGIRGAVQTYENGQIRWSTRGGAHPIWGKILERYKTAEAEGRSLGWPTANEMKDAANGGTYQHFTGGSIYFHPSTGAHRVSGGIRNLWEGPGWERGQMGYPTGEETATAGGGVYQTFQGGTSYWHPRTGSYYVHGAVLGAYGRAGYARGRYGYPLTNETASINGGVFQRFQGGTAYWHPGSDSYFVHDAIFDTYGSYNWERGELGYPLTDETASANGGIFQRFQGGTVYWSARTGSHAVPLSMLDLYGQHGYVRGHLGYPTSEPYWDGNREKQNFEHGVLEKTNDFNVTWAGQPNNYFCGPASGWMILNAIGAHQSAQGTPLSIDAVASRDYMNTVSYGYTSFHDRRFEYGMNRWLGRDAYTTIHTPSVDQVRDSVKSSFHKGLPTAVDAQERRGGPHYNGHPNSTFSHIMVVTSYDPNTDSMRMADPGVHYLWNGEEQFWYHLPSFTQNFLQTEVERDGREHIGIYTAR